MTTSTPSLDELDVLVGEWEITATHPTFAEPTHGSALFEWLEGRTFLIMRSSIEHPDAPDSIAIIGPPSGDVQAIDAPLMMNYHDSRGVHRVYAAIWEERTWRMWRNAPDFNQRFSGTLSADGSVLDGMWQMHRGDEWVDDLAITYRRPAAPPRNGSTQRTDTSAGAPLGGG